MGGFIYVFHVFRCFDAVNDEGLETEVAQIRDSFKFLKIIEIKADPKAKEDKPGGPAGAGAPKEKDKGPDPALLKRAEMKFDHWRFECAKPEGLLNVPPDKFDQSEKDNHLVAKLERVDEESRIMIRVYAQSEKAQQFTIQQLADRCIKYFETTYNEKKRLAPEIDNNFKGFRLAKEAIKLKLVGQRSVSETTYWYIAQCKNERQYQIQIYFTGATAEQHWKNQIDDFMKSFKPKDD
jgi:hypothetical protein